MTNTVKVLRFPDDTTFLIFKIKKEVTYDLSNLTISLNISKAESLVIMSKN